MAKWRKRPGVLDARMGPEPVSTVLSAEQEAIAVAFRRHTLLTYPNPAHDRLTVVRPLGAAASDVLVNALGQVVRPVALPTAETTLDLRGLASGVYVLRLTLDGQPVSKRVVVE